MTVGFSDDFDLELESSSMPVTSGKAALKRQAELPKIGQVVSIGKSGIFEITIAGKNGKEVLRRPKEMNIVILDSDYGRQQWTDTTKDPTLETKRLCSSVSHSIALKDGSRKEVEGGLWKLPYGDVIVNDRYRPMGQKADGRLLSCVQCVEEGLNENCRQKGFIYALVVGITNEDQEMVDLAQPVLVSLQSAIATGVTYQIYVTQKLLAQGMKPNTVITRIGTEKTTNKMAYKLTFELDGEFDGDKLVEANEMYSEARAQAAENELKRIEDYKKTKAEESGKTYKPAGRVAKADKVQSGGDDELDF